MNITKAYFRALLLLMVATALGGTLISFATFGSLPPEMQRYVRAGSGTHLSPEAAWLLVIGGTSLALVTIGGLFVLWRPARTLFLVSCAAGAILSPFLGTSVETAWATTLNEISAMLHGVVLALILWSPLAVHFRPRREGNLPQNMKPEGSA